MRFSTGLVLLAACALGVSAAPPAIRHPAPGESVFLTDTYAGSMQPTDFFYSYLRPSWSVDYGYAYASCVPLPNYWGIIVTDYSSQGYVHIPVDQTSGYPLTYTGDPTQETSKGVYGRVVYVAGVNSLVMCRGFYHSNCELRDMFVSDLTDLAFNADQNKGSFPTNKLFDGAVPATTDDPYLTRECIRIAAGATMFFCLNTGGLSDNLQIDAYRLTPGSTMLTHFRTIVLEKPDVVFKVQWPPASYSHFGLFGVDMRYAYIPEKSYNSENVVVYDLYTGAWKSNIPFYQSYGTYVSDFTFQPHTGDFQITYNTNNALKDLAEMNFKSSTNNKQTTVFIPSYWHRNVDELSASQLKMGDYSVGDLGPDWKKQDWLEFFYGRDPVQPVRPWDDSESSARKAFKAIEDEEKTAKSSRALPYSPLTVHSPSVLRPPRNWMAGREGDMSQEAKLSNRMNLRFDVGTRASQGVGVELTNDKMQRRVERKFMPRTRSVFVQGINLNDRFGKVGYCETTLCTHLAVTLFSATPSIEHRKDDVLPGWPSSMDQEPADRCLRARLCRWSGSQLTTSSQFGRRHYYRAGYPQQANIPGNAPNCFEMNNANPQSSSDEEVCATIAEHDRTSTLLNTVYRLTWDFEPSYARSAVTGSILRGVNQPYAPGSNMWVSFLYYGYECPYTKNNCCTESPSIYFYSALTNAAWPTTGVLSYTGKNAHTEIPPIGSAWCESYGSRNKDEAEALARLSDLERAERANSWDSGDSGVTFTTRRRYPA